VGASRRHGRISAMATLETSSSTRQPVREHLSSLLPSARCSRLPHASPASSGLVDSHPGITNWSCPCVPAAVCTVTRLLRPLEQGGLPRKLCLWRTLHWPQEWGSTCNGGEHLPVPVSPAPSAQSPPSAEKATPRSPPRPPPRSPPPPPGYVIKLCKGAVTDPAKCRCPPLRAANGRASASTPGCAAAWGEEVQR